MHTPLTGALCCATCRQFGARIYARVAALVSATRWAAAHNVSGYPGCDVRVRTRSTTMWTNGLRTLSSAFAMGRLNWIVCYRSQMRGTRRARVCIPPHHWRAPDQTQRTASRGISTTVAPSRTRRKRNCLPFPPFPLHVLPAPAPARNCRCAAPSLPTTSGTLCILVPCRTPPAAAPRRVMQDSLRESSYGVTYVRSNPLDYARARGPLQRCLRGSALPCHAAQGLWRPSMPCRTTKDVGWCDTRGVCSPWERDRRSFVPGDGQ